MYFKELDIVKLRKDYLIAKAGAIGTVLFCFSYPMMAYEVEFFDDTGYSKGSCAILPCDLELVE